MAKSNDSEMTDDHVCSYTELKKVMKEPTSSARLILRRARCDLLRRPFERRALRKCPSILDYRFDLIRPKPVSVAVYGLTEKNYIKIFDFCTVVNDRYEIWALPQKCADKMVRYLWRLFRQKNSSEVLHRLQWLNLYFKYMFTWILNISY